MAQVTWHQTCTCGLHFGCDFCVSSPRVSRSPAVVSFSSFHFGVRPSQSPQYFLSKRFLMGCTNYGKHQLGSIPKQTDKQNVFGQNCKFLSKFWWCKCYLKSDFLLNFTLCVLFENACIKNTFQIHCGSFVSCRGMDEPLITFVLCCCDKAECIFCLYTNENI